MDPGPDIEVHRHAHGGRWLDTVLAVTAVAISVVTAVLAIQHGNAMERMVEASSWPYLQVGDSNGDAQGHALYKLILTNQGVGPAKIRKLAITYQGRPMTTVFYLAKAFVSTERMTPPNGVTTSDAVVIPARETNQLLTVASPLASPELIRAFIKNREAITVSACYCSIFDECWTTSNQGPSTSPIKVHDCGGPVAGG